MNGQYVDGAKLRVDFSMTSVPIERLQNPSRRSRSRERRRNDFHDRRRSYSRERRRSPARERSRHRRRSRSGSRRRHRPILKEEY
ncbi:hypothetical protein AAVH_08004 [Aphelenchoides avenae]|nr:hypothetical protein AAVH_08004 [Aphelenchus avenae]